MNKKLIIIGAGGHGRVVADIARLQGYRDIAFLDDQQIAGVRQIGCVSDYEHYVDCGDFFVAIGNNGVRKAVFERLHKSCAKIVNLVHPKAVIAEDVVFGQGVAVMAGAVVNTGSRIENGAIINTCASVDHDCVVGAFSHVSVGSHLAGTVTLGERTMFGAGATVINNVNICKDCVVGAGAVVVKDIEEPGVYVGVPCRRMK